jgi:hypothetical protein
MPGATSNAILGILEKAAMPGPPLCPNSSLLDDTDPE